MSNNLIGGKEMNAEQIKQNAEKYAINGNTRGSLSLEILFQNTRDAFIAGAHSRDKEIESLQRRVSMWKHEAEVAAKELNQLRNPWISVDDRLPEKNCKVMVAGGEYDIAIYHAAPRKFYTAYKELQKKIGEKSDVGSYMIGGDCVQTEEYFSRGEREDITETVTHWIPIPELPKGDNV